MATTMDSTQLSLLSRLCTVLQDPSMPALLDRLTLPDLPHPLPITSPPQPLIRKNVDTYIGYIDLYSSKGRFGTPLLYR
jgi:hypothetical protein